VENLAATANQTTGGGVDPRYAAAQVQTQKRGLTTTDVRALNTIQANLKQISDACDELAAAVGSDRICVRRMCCMRIMAEGRCPRPPRPPRGGGEGIEASSKLQITSSKKGPSSK
jgi:hypothetical protein